MEFTTCTKITEDNNSNIEVFIRELSPYLMMRGVAFIFHEVKGCGSEIIIFSNMLRLQSLIAEADKFISIKLNKTSEWTTFVAIHGEEIDLSCNIVSRRCKIENVILR